jgi:MFS family permease
MAATTGAARRPQLRSIGLLVYVFMVTMLGTTLPTPLYPDYQHRFGFGQLTETAVFAIYAVGVLATLVLFGQVSDVIGRRPMLFASIGAAAVSAIGAVPETVSRAPGRRRPFITPLRPRAVLAQANAISLAGFTGFAVLGLFAAVTPSFLDRLGQHAPISTGLVVFSVFAASALGQLSTMRLQPRTTLMVGVATLTVGAAVVGAGLHLPSIPVLVTGGLVAGAGQGMSFHAALSQATASSPPTERGAAASSFFVICYLGISLPVIGLGAATGAWGLLVAGQAFAGAVVAIGVTTLARLPRPGTRPNQTDPVARVG